MNRETMYKWLRVLVPISFVALSACAQPDAVITAKVKAGMLADTSVNASHITVSTHDKVVTLTGNIDSAEEKTRALEIARSTGGVARVEDMIEVRTSEETGAAPSPDRTVGEHIDDAVITASVKDKLIADPLVKAHHIDVDTRDGVVFLTGKVASKEESDRAVELARSAEHVKDVRPNLIIAKG